jgi:hypothetical protein
MKKSVTRFSLFILSLAASLTAQAQHTDTLYPAQDAYVITMGGGQGKNSFLKFDISSIPANSVVGNVKVEVNVTDIGASWDGDMIFYNVNNQTWVETDSQQVVYAYPRTDSILQASGFGTAPGIAQSVDIKQIFLTDYNQSNNFCTVMMKDSNDVTFAPLYQKMVNSPDSLMSGNIFSDFIVYSPREQSDSVPMMIVTYTVAPSVVVHPQNVTVCDNISAATFSITATGDVPLSYQWQKNGVDIPGATSNVYTINPAVLSDAGNYRCYVTNSVGSDTSGNGILFVNPNPAVNLGPDVTVCGSTVLDAGGGFATYSWSPPVASTQTLTVTTSDTYYASVTDNNGCPGVDTVNVTVLPVVSVNLGADITVCVSALLDAGNPGSYYAWGGGETTQMLNVTTSGQYMVAAWNTCSGDTDTVNVTVSNVPKSITLFVNNVTCNGGNNGTIYSDTTSAGVSPLSYLWSNMDSIYALIGAQAGSYTLTITDANGCLSIDSATITEPAPASIPMNVNNASCNGGTGTIYSDTTSAGSSPLNFMWSNGSNIYALLGAQAGVYTLTITATNGCISIDSATITQPPPASINFFVNNVTCNGGNNGTIYSDTTLAGPSPLSYLWSNMDSIYALLGMPAGTYTLTITAANGCISVDSATITQPAAMNVSASSTPATCGMWDGSASVNVSGGNSPYTYSWSTTPAQATTTATGLNAGNYTVSITDAIGCTSSGTVAVNATGNILQSTFAAGNAHRGNMFDVTAINTVMITDFDGHLQGNTSYEIYYHTGTYVGTEQNASAWTLVGSAANVVAQPTGNPTPIPIPVNITIPAGQTYAFYLTSSNLAVSQNYTNGTAVGNVYASDANIQFKEGCGLEYPFASTPFTPRIWNGRIHYCTGPVGMENVLSSEMKAYPNPSNGTFTLSGLLVNAKIEVVNIFGAVVFEKKASADTETINLTETPGIYFYRVTNENGETGTGKMVIE